jgi:hypothetical protein
LKEFFKVLVNPGLFFPLLYNVILIAVPNLGDVCNFILLNKGGWSLEQISYVTLSTGIFFSFFMIWFLKTCMPKIPFYLAYVIGGSSLVLTNMLQYFFLEPLQLGFGKMFIIFWLQT